MSAANADAPVDVIVVGAGLAGLAAACTLQAAGRRVLLVEGSDGVGGRVRTDLVDGFRLDRGFQVLLTAYPDVARQLDTAALDLRAFDPGAAVVTSVTGGRARIAAVGDPLRRPTLLASSALAPVGSIADKMRLAAMLLRLRRADPVALLRAPDRSTLDELRALGFSSRMIDRFFRPLLGGIQLDPTLSGSARMSDVVLRCLAVGSSVVPALGMQRMPEQLAARLAPGTVRLHATVAAVQPGEVRLAHGEVLRASSIVVATDGPTASRLLTGRAVRDPGDRSVGAVWFSAPRSPVDHKLIVLDGAASGPALNVAPMSNVAPDYAGSTGRALLVAACPDVGEVSTLADRVRTQLRTWWGPQVDDWTALRTDVIRHGQPDQRPPFTPKRRLSLGDGLWVCGDHRDTPSIQGALFSGRRCAEAMLAG